MRVTQKERWREITLRMLENVIQKHYFISLLKIHIIFYMYIYIDT